MYDEVVVRENELNFFRGLLVAVIMWRRFRWDI